MGTTRSKYSQGQRKGNRGSFNDVIEQVEWDQHNLYIGVESPEIAKVICRMNGFNFSQSTVLCNSRMLSEGIVT